MICTVTLSPSWDTVAVVERLRMGEVNRSCRVFSYPGGKGIDVARTVRQLGGETLALGFVAGPNGERSKAALRAEGIPHDFVEVAGDTRSNILLEHASRSQETIIQHPSDVAVTANDLEALTAGIRQAGRTARILVFGGSIPAVLSPSIYRDLIAVARESGCRTILDASGEALREGVRAHPYMIKPNRSEIEQLCGRRLHSPDEIIEALHSPMLAEVEVVVVSLGAEGVVVRSKSDLFRVDPIAARVVSYAGAGDSLIGGLALGLSMGRELREAVVMGVAAATATLSQYGSSFFDLKNYETNRAAAIIREVHHAV